MQAENTTVFDMDLVADTARVLTRRYKIIIAICAAVLLAMAVLYILSYGFQGSLFVLAIIGTGMAIVLVVGTVRIRGYKKMLMARMRVVSNQDRVVYEYVVDNEKIVATNPTGTITLFHSDIKKIHETKKQHIIIYDGQIFLPMAKDGWVSGSLETILL